MEEEEGGRTGIGIRQCTKEQVFFKEGTSEKRGTVRGDCKEAVILRGRVHRREIRSGVSLRAWQRQNCLLMTWACSLSLADPGAVVEAQTSVPYAIVGGILALLVFLIICVLVGMVWCSVRQKGEWGQGLNSRMGVLVVGFGRGGASDSKEGGPRGSISGRGLHLVSKSGGDSKGVLV